MFSSRDSVIVNEVEIAYAPSRSRASRRHRPIVNGACRRQRRGGGFVATGGDGGLAATDRLVSQVRDQVSTLRGQAGDKLRGFADDGKGRATGLLDDFSEVIDDAAKSIDERLGEDYGGYAHRAADAVSTFAGKVRDKSVDDLHRRHPRFRPQEPGHRDRHRRGGRLRSDPAWSRPGSRMSAAARGAQRGDDDDGA